MIQGWRPNSVTNQPASMARNPSGAVSCHRQELADGPGRCVSSTRPAPRTSCHEQEEEAYTHHRLEREVDEARVGDVVLREAVQTPDLGVEVFERQEARQLRDLDGVAGRPVPGIGDAADPQGAPLSVSNCPSMAANFSGWL